MSDLFVSLVLLGPPGSGKGTQAELLAQHLEVPAISTGEMIRAAMTSGSELGRRVEEIVNSGSLVDDETMGYLVRERLSEPDVERGFLLDGYPRTLPQADTLAGILRESGRTLGAVVMIDVPEDELLGRMLDRGREDDTEDVIRRRLQVYRAQTEPLVEHYRALGLLLAVDGAQSVEGVHETILEALEVGAPLRQEVEG
jgi:adenylate kinase